MVAPLYIGAAGTHSTGKTSFCDSLEKQLLAKGIRVARVPSFGKEAAAKGIPLLHNHTYQSTLWIIERTIEAQLDAEKKGDVVLVDRPVPDALAYLRAAMEFRSECPDPSKISEIEEMVQKELLRYDFLFATVLDQSIPLGQGRDSDLRFRALVAKHLDQVLQDLNASHQKLSTKNFNCLIDEATTKMSIRLKS